MLYFHAPFNFKKTSAFLAFLGGILKWNIALTWVKLLVTAGRKIYAAGEYQFKWLIVNVIQVFAYLLTGYGKLFFDSKSLIELKARVEYSLWPYW